MLLDRKRGEIFDATLLAEVKAPEEHTPQTNFEESPRLLIGWINVDPVKT